MKQNRPLKDTGDDELAVLKAIKILDTAKKQCILDHIEMLKSFPDNSMISSSSNNITGNKNGTLEN